SYLYEPGIIIRAFEKAYEVFTDFKPPYGFVPRGHPGPESLAGVNFLWTEAVGKILAGPIGGLLVCVMLVFFSVCTFSSDNWLRGVAGVGLFLLMVAGVETVVTVFTNGIIDLNRTLFLAKGAFDLAVVCFICVVFWQIANLILGSGRRAGG
ncbi:MAG: hypothetical protein RMI39_06000, partial [Thermoanaerobaculum sp.]|nr:hypothetical protein [Thermoanaerobaculum sp.]